MQDTYWVQNCRLTSFYFSTLKILLYFLLAQVDYKNFAVIFIFVHLYVICHFYLVALRFFFYTTPGFSNFILMFFGLVVFLFLQFGFYEFSLSEVYVFYQFQESFRQIFLFLCLSFPLLTSGSLITCKLDCLMLPDKSISGLIIY